MGWAEMDSTGSRDAAGKVVYVTERLWLLGRSHAGPSAIRRVSCGCIAGAYGQVATVLHGTWELLFVGSEELGQLAAEVITAGRSGQSTVRVGKPRTSGRTAVGQRWARHGAQCQCPAG